MRRTVIVVALIIALGMAGVAGRGAGRAAPGSPVASPGVGSPVASPVASPATAGGDLVERLLETPWTDETFPMGDEAMGEERVAVTAEALRGADGGVRVTWEGGPWTLIYLVFATPELAEAERERMFAGAESDGLSISTTSMDGVEANCILPPTIEPGSPDPGVCLAVSGEVLAIVVGDDHDASRVAFLLFAGLGHLEAVRTVANP